MHSLLFLKKREEEEGREKSFIVIFESFINFCESDFLFMRFRIFGPKVRNYYSKGFSLGQKCETKRRRSKGVRFSDATHSEYIIYSLIYDVNLI